MAYRPTGYGYTADLNRKLNSKYSEGDELELVTWIKACTGLDGPEKTGAREFQKWLMDGQVLCALVNSFGMDDIVCEPKDTSKYGAKSPMKAMIENENIGKFLDAIKLLGVSAMDTFQTVYLREGQNLAQVQTTLYKVGSALKARNWDGPEIGVKHSTKNQREFSDEQQRSGQNVIGLQMGTNQVASQKGMTAYGLGRQIVDKR